MDAPRSPSPLPATRLDTLPPGLPIAEVDITSPVLESPQRASPLSPTSRRFTTMTAVTDVGDWSILKRETKIVALTTAVPTFHIMPGFGTTKSNSSAGSVKDLELGVLPAEATAPAPLPRYTKRQIATSVVLIILVPGILAAIITILIMLLSPGDQHLRDTS
ncbi:hypothetical protein AURDEDRAFT_175152 [Auricularia subglabra TFB-10046 SS5]|nr:hypothetical protein AURDEDRAFT_175152 [Auricularia subglabra TFB-10046 SS5]